MGQLSEYRRGGFIRTRIYIGMEIDTVLLHFIRILSSIESSVDVKNYKPLRRLPSKFPTTLRSELTVAVKPGRRVLT